MALTINRLQQKKIEALARQHGVKASFILRELDKGVEVEKEHTASLAARMKIALDHLKKDPNHYTNELESDRRKTLYPRTGVLTIQKPNAYLEVEIVYSSENAEMLLRERQAVKKVLNTVGVGDISNSISKSSYPKKVKTWGRTNWGAWDRGKDLFYKGLNNLLKTSKLPSIGLAFNGMVYEYKVSLAQGGKPGVAQPVPVIGHVLSEAEINAVKHLVDTHNKLNKLAQVPLSEALGFYEANNGGNDVAIYRLKKYLRQGIHRTGSVNDEFAAGGVVDVDDVDPEMVNKLRAAMRKSRCVLNRDVMPQVMAENYDDYIQYLNSLGYQVHFGKKKAKELIPSQCDLNAKRVARIVGKRKSGQARQRKYIIGKENYIVDGHHSWGGAYVDNPNELLDTIEVDAPITDLIMATKAYPKVEYELI